MTKQEIIDQLIAKQELPPLVVVELLKRSILRRVGGDITKDWMWNIDYLRFYDEKALEDILKLTNTNNEVLQPKDSRIIKY